MLKSIITSAFFATLTMYAYSVHAAPTSASTEVATASKKFSEKPLKVVIAEAKAGSVAAQLYLGIKYSQGEGVKQDHRESVKWLTAAAEQGHPKAQTMLGAAYTRGMGVAQNDYTAHNWYLLASMQDYDDANYMLGMRHLKGTEGTPKNIEKGIALLKRAADQKIADAQINLGIFHLKGEHVAKNPKVSAELFRSAAMSGSSAGCALLGVLYESGLGVPKSKKHAWLWTSLSLQINPDSVQEQNTLADLEKTMTALEREEAAELATACVESGFVNCP